MPHYYAIAERADDGGWFLVFPGGSGYSHAADAGQIVQQAQDWLETAGMEGGTLPPSIEDGALPPTDLSDFKSPLVIVIPFTAPVTQAAAQ